MINGELIIDNFAGGGGTSTGCEMATGYSPDIAINHDPEAIRLHKVNHPNTVHYTESVLDINPIEVCRGHPVALCWLSPDCKHFSKAKGGTPVSKNIRGLAWVALRWASAVRPRVIILENVEEFKTWGPLRPMRDKHTGRVKVKEVADDSSVRYITRIADIGEVVPADMQFMEPDPKRKGKTFKKFVKNLENLGYKVDFHELIAADYGAPTSRKRFFMIARCDGRPIIWPERTHAPKGSEEVENGLLKPYRGAYECIDFSLPCPSIFDTSAEIKEKYGLRAVRPLAEKTMERIARGLEKFVLNNPEPFIIPIGYGERAGQSPRIHDIKKPMPTVVGSGKHYLVSPTLMQYHSETSDKEVRGQKLEDPVMTLDGSNRYGLVSTFIQKYYGGNCKDKGPKSDVTLHIANTDEDNSLAAVTMIQMNNNCFGRDITEPMATVVAGDGHFGEVMAFLVKFYGNGSPEDIKEPLDTITTKDRFGLVRVNGVDYQIVDIGLRMLEPRELYNAQGFPADYIIDHDIEGNSYSRSEQVKRCGNAVPPPFAEALIRANLPELCVAERTPNMRIDASEPQLRFA